MIKRRNFLGSGLAVALAAGLLMAAPAAHARADEFGDGARKFISNLAQTAIHDLTGKDLSREERAKRFRHLMLKTFAIKGIAKFVLGRHWRQATEPERKEYLQLFEDLLVATYADRFARYSGESLEIKNAEIHGKNDALVHSSFLKVDGTKPIDVIWRVRAKGDAYFVVDIMVEGISMVQTQKSEFASFIKQNGGSLEALFSEIKKRIEAVNT